MPRIAFYTFGILREKEGHPQVQGFYDRIDSVFKQARSSVGFIALSDPSWGEYVSPRFYDKEKHAVAPATLSLWKDLESVCAFAYRNNHGETFKLRQEWALKPEWPTYVAWWVDDDHIPNRKEACEKLEYLHDNGSGPSAFTFKTPFDQYGQKVELSRQLVEERVKSNEK
ncbi:MAG TPA: DUF3291 domain-containing protein [Ignavibacteria bacterium]|nr:DUF3291 domain-containing protein [Ignavibacteria bacterium]